MILKLTHEAARLLAIQDATRAMRDTDFGGAGTSSAEMPSENREFDWVCPDCGSDDCEMTAWVHMNSAEVCDGEGPGERYWCPACEDHPRRLVLRGGFESGRGES